MHRDGGIRQKAHAPIPNFTKHPNIPRDGVTARPQWKLLTGLLEGKE